MLTIAILAFLGVFVAIALPWIASASDPAKKSKLVMNVLDSALASHDQAARQHLLSFRKDEQVSSIPWLNRKLLGFELIPRLQAVLDQADLKWSVGRLLALSGVCGLLPGYVVWLRYDHFVPALLSGLVTGCAPALWVLRKRAKRMDLFVQQLPEGLDLMVSGLRAGHSLISALGLVASECPAPLGSEFKACFDEQNYGLELRTAFANLVRRMPVQDLKIVVSAIMIQKESGGNLAELLDKASQTVRQRFRLKRQIRVHTAQGRMTGVILTILPIALGILLYFLNPTMMSVLWHNPLGIKLMCAAAGMMVLGGLVIRSIVDIDV